MNTLRLKLNVRSAILRLIGIVLYCLPFKVVTFNLLSCSVGVVLLFKEIYQWNNIIWFARHTKSPLFKLAYLIKYYLQKGKNITWGYFLYETSDQFTRYITVKGAETVQPSLAGEKGAIILGAHYGPAFYAYIIKSAFGNLKELIDPGHLKLMQDINTLVLKPFRNRQAEFFCNSEIFLIKQRQERQFVSYAKKKGVVLMHLDIPTQAGKHGSSRIFDRLITTHVFPFRLALKYDIPVFFCIFENKKHGGYEMKIKPFGPFTTPADGFQRYLDYIQAAIEKNPFMWAHLPFYHDWTTEQ